VTRLKSFTYGHMLLITQDPQSLISFNFEKNIFCEVERILNLMIALVSPL